MLERRFRIAPLALLSFVAGGAGCDELLGVSYCHDAACIDETAVMVERPGVVWADGDYTLEIGLDGTRYECPFFLPLPKLPHELQLNGEPFRCTPELPNLGVGKGTALYPKPDVAPSCLSTRDAGAQPPIASCPPLDGQYHLEIHTSETPAELELRLKHGDVVLLERREAVQYTKTAPNGPECGPVCSHAQLEYRVVEPD